jgi:hypothetical protein
MYNVNFHFNKHVHEKIVLFYNEKKYEKLIISIKLFIQSELRLRLC